MHGIKTLLLEYTKSSNIKLSLEEITIFSVLTPCLEQFLDLYRTKKYIFYRAFNSK